jgi:hypothetical protein
MGMAARSPPAQAAPQAQAQAPKPKPATSTFDDLWATSLGAPVLAPAAASGKKTIAQMQQENSTNQLWGKPAAAPAGASNSFQQPAKPAGGAGASAFDDLLL